MSMAALLAMSMVMEAELTSLRISECSVFCEVFDGTGIVDGVSSEGSGSSLAIPINISLLSLASSTLLDRPLLSITGS